MRQPLEYEQDKTRYSGGAVRVNNVLTSVEMCIRDRVSVPEYLAYTTEETEKVEVQRLAGELGGDMELAIRQLAEGKR